MKKIMIAALGLSLLPVGAVFAQNTSTDTSGTMKSTKKSHHKKKSTSTMSTTSTSSK